LSGGRAVPVSTDKFREALAALSEEYRAELPERMLELDALWSAAQTAVQPPQTLRRALHSIAGSARTFGLPELSSSARRAEQLLDACCERGEPLPQEAKADFESLLQALKTAASARQAP
jgi:HPt (histidine-containing phosphotransfer) domain-containing protein